jgi:hypothetical protein
LENLRLENLHISTKKFGRFLKIAAWMSVSIMTTTFIVIEKTCHFLMMKYHQPVIAIIVGTTIYLIGMTIVNKYLDHLINDHNDQLIAEAEDLANALTEKKITDQEQLIDLLTAMTSHRK